MRPINTFFGILVILVTPPGFAIEESTPSQLAIRAECSKEGSQIAMKACLTHKASQSAIELERMESGLRQTLARWDEDPRYITQAQAQFEHAVQAFDRFRKSHCNFMASLAGGAAGNAKASMRLACIAELNNHRAAQLKDAVANLPLK